MTNLERIRNMSADKLAEFLDTITACCYSMGRYGSEACEECPMTRACDTDTKDFVEWLESEVE